MMRPEFSRERFFVGAPRYCNGMTAHPGGELHAEVTQTTQPEYRNDVAGSCAAVSH